MKTITALFFFLVVGLAFASAQNTLRAIITMPPGAYAMTPAYLSAPHTVQSASPEIGQPAVEVTEPTEVGLDVRQQAAAAIGQPAIEVHDQLELPGDAIRKDADVGVEE